MIAVSISNKLHSHVLSLEEVASKDSKQHNHDDQGEPHEQEVGDGDKTKHLREKFEERNLKDFFLRDAEKFSAASGNARASLSY